MAACVSLKCLFTFRWKFPSVHFAHALSLSLSFPIKGCQTQSTFLQLKAFPNKNKTLETKWSSYQNEFSNDNKHKNKEEWTVTWNEMKITTKSLSNRRTNSFISTKLKNHNLIVAIIIIVQYKLIARKFIVHLIRHHSCQYGQWTPSSSKS